MFSKRQTGQLTSILMGAAAVTCPIAGILAHSHHQLHHYPLVSNSCTKTEAGNINFDHLKNLDNKLKIFQKIKAFSDEDQTITLTDGSRWHVSPYDIVKGWGHSERLVLTQNHTVFSLHKYALINLDLEVAVPINLLILPIPQNENIHYIKDISYNLNTCLLDTNQQFGVHASDRGTLNKFYENNVVYLGVNTCDQDLAYPYIIIDAGLHSNSYVRAALKPTKVNAK